MQLSELFNQGKFVVTAEIGPPKGVNIENMLEDIELLKGKVDAANVTDQQSSVMRIGSLATCVIAKQKGLEPILQMTCRDRNRIALQSDLLSAYILGIENILSLTGDYVSLGDHPEAKPVFDLDSVSLLQVAKKLQEGHDMAGNELEGAPKFTLGAVVSPGYEPLEAQIIKLEKKVEAGAQFIQTQAVYEAEKFEDFMEKIKYLNVPIMLGIVLLKSAGMAKYMNKFVAGVHVPENLIEEMDKAENKVEKSVEIAARLINDMRHLCQGVHIMPIGWEKHVPAVIDAAGL